MVKDMGNMGLNSSHFACLARSAEGSHGVEAF